MITTEENKLIEDIVSRYDEDTGMLIPMMQDLQAACGWSSARMKENAQSLAVTPSAHCDLPEILHTEDIARVLRV